MSASPRFTAPRLDGDVPAAMCSALLQLANARRYATELEFDAWDFAVEVHCLHRAGLTTSDLRWLLCKGYVAHAAEISPPGADRRQFKKLGLLRLTKRTCFVLTDAGLEALDSSNGSTLQFNLHLPQVRGAPCWDGRRRELRLGDQLVKRFRVPALNQELILSAFQEDDWPAKLDDPLPPLPGLDSKRRLHDAIKSLNRRQIRPLLRFHGDGSGRGIHWDYVPHITPTSSPALP